MGSGQCRNRFQLDDDGIETGEVSLECPFQDATFVPNRKFDFATKRDLPLDQFERECFLIDRFEKSTSQVPMNFHRSANNGIRTRVTFINHLDYPNRGCSTS